MKLLLTFPVFRFRFRLHFIQEHSTQGQQTVKEGAEKNNVGSYSYIKLHWGRIAEYQKKGRHKGKSNLLNFVFKLQSQPRPECWATPTCTNFYATVVKWITAAVRWIVKSLSDSSFPCRHCLSGSGVKVANVTRGGCNCCKDMRIAKRLKYDHTTMGTPWWSQAQGPITSHIFSDIRPLKNGCKLKTTWTWYMITLITVDRDHWCLPILALCSVFIL